MSAAVPSAGETAYAYVNRARTHEVLALAETDGDAVRWSVTERPAGSEDPKEWMVEESVEPRARVGTLVRELEARLAATGEYLRVPRDAPPEALAPPPALDLRGHAVPIPGAKPEAFLEYFHFHGGPSSRVVMALPRTVVAPTEKGGERYVLANFDFPTGMPRSGRLAIAHPRLSPALVVSRVAGEHLALPRRGMRKLYEPREYEDALGISWRQKAKEVVNTAAEFLFRAKPRAPPVVDLAPPSAQEADLFHALASASYRAARLDLVPGADALVASSELAIRGAVRLARRTAAPDEQPRISLAESGLLVEYGIRHGRVDLVREYGAQLVRLARSYGYAV